MMHSPNFNRSDTSVLTDDPLTPYVLNVYFTIINDTGNTNSLNAQGILATPEEIENKFQDCMKYLNTAYNSANIFFKYAGYQEVVSHAIATQGGWFTFYTSQTNPVWSPNDIAQYKKTDAMNFIFLDTQSGAASGEFAYQGYNASLSDMSLLINPNLERILVHKMGHNLSLFHTYEAVSHFVQSSPYYNLTNCEHVTRDPFAVGYNADIAGDEVIDTAAQPVVSDTNFVNSCGDYITGNQGTDCNNTFFTGIVNGNHMQSLDVNSICTRTFTQGQSKKMREFILNNPTVFWDMNMTIHYYPGVISNALNSVESLYQPYSVSNIMGDYVVSITDNGNGTATVCRNRLEQQKFQKGFDYIFPENISPDPLTATINDIPVVTQHTLDYPVTILQLAPGITNLTTNTGYAKLNCTRGVVCQIEPFKLGIVFSTDILGSMNMTIRELNEMQVKDPNLYDNFLQHYYYIVKKQTESGAQTQEAFYKQ
jgi:hypothetical protein